LKLIYKSFNLNYTKKMNITRLPPEIMSMIFLYLQNPEAKLIENEIKFYEKDTYYEKVHTHDCSKLALLHYLKNYMSFQSYYFHLKMEPCGYHIRKEYYMKGFIIGVVQPSVIQNYL